MSGAATVSPMTLPVPSFASPVGKRIRLRVPVLQSFDPSSSRDQHRMDRFLDDSEELMAPELAALFGPTALRLDLGLPPSKSLLQQPSLDSYAFPLAERLKAVGGQQFASVWCTKRHADFSTITVGPAVPDAPPVLGRTTTLTTRRSYAKVQFKEAIREAVAGLTPIPEGPVALHIAYVTGLPRTWANLWRPTIHGLGGLLGGSSNPLNPWDIDGERIVQLALHHRTEGPSLEHKVQITVTAEPILQAPKK
jgi:hypothetical protein